MINIHVKLLNIVMIFQHLEICLEMIENKRIIGVHQWLTIILIFLNIVRKYWVWINMNIILNINLKKF